MESCVEADGKFCETDCTWFVIPDNNIGTQVSVGDMGRKEVGLWAW